MESFQTSCNRASSLVFRPWSMGEGSSLPQNKPFSHLKCMSTLHPSALLFPPSPRLLGATEGYKQRVMRGKGCCVQGGGAVTTPLLWLYCLLSKPSPLLVVSLPVTQTTLYPEAECKTHTHTHTSGHFFSLLLNTVILCLLMGTGSSVPRVPPDNWLLPHLLTSLPLTFLHFTFKVLHFFSPF